MYSRRMLTSTPYNLDLIFQALADPTRRAILRDVASQERSISEIAKPYKMSLAGISKHLKVLERANLVQRRRQGYFFYLKMNAEALQSAEEWLAYYRKFWDIRLDALQNFLEKEEK